MKLKNFDSGEMLGTFNLCLGPTTATPAASLTTGMVLSSYGQRNFMRPDTQPNLGNACILGTFGPVTHPLLKCKNWKLPHFGFPALVQLSVCLQAAPLAVFKLQHGMMIGQRSDQIAAEEEENDQG